MARFAPRIDPFRMYLAHYGLAEPPYSITPDPRFVFLSERHRDALAHLSFGIQQGGGGGFVQLTGEVGTGKTTLSRLLLEQLPANTRVALVLNPRQGAVELLETICSELGIDIDGPRPARGSAKALVDALNGYLLDAYAQGMRVVLLVDEAQALPVDALEQVRLLTNLETDTQKLLQVVLLGQPELRDVLAREDLRQLSQRITARFHLTPLDRDETGEYLRHRYRIAGGARFPFTPGAMRRIHAHSGGVPRITNVVAERALVAGYARDVQAIDETLVDLAAREVLPTRAASWHARGWPMLLAGAGVLAVAALAFAAWRGRTPAAPIAPAPAAVRASVPARTQPEPRPVATPVDAAALAHSIRIAGDDPQAAWQALLKAWGVPAAAITVDADGACTAVASDVHCLRGSARLEKLLALDRPAVLALRDGDTRAFALLRGIDARRARIALGTRTLDVDRADLLQAWDGRYRTLWRGPALPDAPLARGASGAAVDWLHARLGLVRAPSSPFDAETLRAVARFQSARGLPADGVAGPETLMALAGDAPGPRLSRTLE